MPWRRARRWFLHAVFFSRCRRRCHRSSFLFRSVPSLPLPYPPFARSAVTSISPLSPFRLFFRAVFKARRGGSRRGSQRVCFNEKLISRVSRRAFRRKKRRSPSLPSLLVLVSFAVLDFVASLFSRSPPRFSFSLFLDAPRSSHSFLLSKEKRDPFSPFAV